MRPSRTDRARSRGDPLRRSASSLHPGDGSLAGVVLATRRPTDRRRGGLEVMTLPTSYHLVSAPRRGGAERGGQQGLRHARLPLLADEPFDPGTVGHP
jgi:hypothetical protein